MCPCAPTLLFQWCTTSIWNVDKAILFVLVPNFDPFLYFVNELAAWGALLPCHYSVYVRLLGSSIVENNITTIRNNNRPIIILIFSKFFKCGYTLKDASIVSLTNFINCVLSNHPRKLNQFSCHARTTTDEFKVRSYTIFILGKWGVEKPLTSSYFWVRIINFNHS